MSFNCEDLPTRSREEFCRALKQARERKAITLVQIERATKIPASLFAGLEKNDLRFWPTGLYRRSFFRDYVRFVGLPESELCAEFARLFAHDDVAAKSHAEPVVEEAPPPTDLRLILDADWHAPRPSFVSRLAAAALDATAVVIMAAALAWVAQTDWRSTAALVAVMYFSLATVMFGESPAQWILARHRSILEAWQRVTTTASPAAPSPAKPVEPNVEGADADRAPWVTDAHRVGPPPSAHLRFRVKAS